MNGKVLVPCQQDNIHRYTVSTVLGYSIGLSSTSKNRGHWPVRPSEKGIRLAWLMHQSLISHSVLVLYSACLTTVPSLLLFVAPFKP